MGVFSKSTLESTHPTNSDIRNVLKVSLIGREMDMSRVSIPVLVSHSISGELAESQGS
jgi:hypothetical protein